MEKALYEAIADKKSLLKFVQRHATDGMVCYRESDPKQLWLDEIASEQLHWNMGEGIYLKREQVLDQVYDSLIRKCLDAPQETHLIALRRPDDSLLTYDLKAVGFEKNGENYILLGLSRSTVQNQDSLLGYRGMNEQAFEDLLSPHAFYLIKTDLDGNYTYLNDYFCERLGFAREELLGKSSLLQIIPQDQAKCVKVVEECFHKPGKSIRTILRKPSPEGGFFTNEWYFCLRTDPQGVPLEFVCTGYDISIHSFQLLYEKAPTMLHSMDRSQKLVNVSDLWLEKLGYQREEVIGKKLVSFMTEESKVFAESEAFPAFFRARHCKDVHYRMICKDGSIMDVLISGILLDQQSGGTAVSVAYLRDITQDELNKAKAKSLASLNKSILDNTKIQMWAFDGELYRYMNREWYQYTGQDPELPLTVERWTERVHPDDLTEALETWTKNWAKKTAHDNYFRLKRHDGVYRSFYCHASPVWDEAGRFLYFQGYNLDITERLEAEAHLKEREEMFRLITEVSSELICMHDPDGTYRYVSPSAYKLTGYQPDELLGKSPYDFFHPDHIDEIQQHHQEVLTRQKNASIIYRFKTKSGVFIWLDTFTDIIKASDGTVSQLITRSRDVTERVIAQQQIKISQQKLKRLTANVPGFIFEYNRKPDGKSYFSFISEGIKITNPDVDPDQIKDNPDIGNAFLLTEDLIEFQEKLDYSWKNLSLLDLEYRINRHDKIYWHHVIAMPKAQADGTVSWAGIALDTTEKHEAVARAHQLANVAESTGDLILVCDAEGKATWANEEYHRFMGGVEEILRKNPTDRIRTDEAFEPLLQQYEQALIEHIHFFDTLPIFAGDQQRIWLSIRVRPIFDASGQFQYSIVSKRDVGDLIEKQEELKSLLDNLTEQNSRLKEYAYITSHNIRSSVARLGGLIELAAGDPQNQEYQTMLRTSLTNLDSTIHNINELLHLEKEFSADEKSMTDLTDAVQRAIELNSTIIESKGVKITYSANVEAPQLLTIPAYLDSILQNLLSNALKYGVTPLSQSIEIRVESHADRIELTVADQGVGMDLEKDGNRLFKLGARLHDFSKGQGMGLFMVKRQVESLGGTISVESQPYQGTKFSVVLPRPQA